LVAVSRKGIKPVAATSEDDVREDVHGALLAEFMLAFSAVISTLSGPLKGQGSAGFGGLRLDPPPFSIRSMIRPSWRTGAGIGSQYSRFRVGLLVSELSVHIRETDANLEETSLPMIWL
jgi:hypothetical protein